MVMETDSYVYKDDTPMDHIYAFAEHLTMGISENLAFLPNIVALLAAAVVVVAVFKRLNLSPVLGYLVAGAAIGEYGLNYIQYEEVKSLAKFGVVLLLFTIGIELTLERLISMRSQVFGFGSLQFALTGVLISAIAYYLGGLSLESSVVIGGALALSSTAVVLQVIADDGRQASQVGRLSLAVLLLQDLAVVPLLVLVPLLAADHGHLGVEMGVATLKALVAMLLIFFAGRLLLRPIFKLIAATKSDELFIATTLLIVLGTSLVTEYLELSLALGAFIAGLLVAETQYNNQVEDTIKPFKGLLMGLFFMSVGMTFDLTFMVEHLLLVLALSGALLLLKSLIIIILCWWFSFSVGASVHAGLLLAQGGEFAFILFGLAAEQYLLDKETAQILLMVVTVSMAITPLLSTLGRKVAEQLDDADVDAREADAEVYDLDQHVIICGYGRVGRMVARMLNYAKVNYVIVDLNSQRVAEGREDCEPIYRGDASRLDTLEHLALERASAVIVTVDNKVTIERVTRVVREAEAEVPVIVRTRDFGLQKRLEDAGATTIVPETYETGLQLGAALLANIGFLDDHINMIKSQFRAGKYAKAVDLDAAELD